MVCTREKNSRNKRQLVQLDENLNDFVIGSGITTNTLGNETSERQANDRHGDFERFVDNASQNQVTGNNTDDKIRDAVNSAVIVVKNCTHDAILTAMNDVVTPQVEMVVRSITGSSGNGPNGLVQSLDLIGFTGNTKNTPLRSASSRFDLIIEQDGIVETRDIDNSEDGDFPATKLN